MEDDRASDDPAAADPVAAYAGALADGIEAALPGWVERVVRDRVVASGAVLSDGDLTVTQRAGQEARRVVGAEVRALLARDVDDQPTGPLDVLRGAVRYPTEVLRAAGVPEVTRDDWARRIQPDDVYDLAPARFADLDPTLQDLGIAWGAAKAHVVLARRRREGKR